MSEHVEDPAEQETAATLENLAREYYSVRRAEFTLTDEETQNIIDNAKGRLDKLAAAAVENVAHLMEHADSDAVRWNVTKYVMDHVLFKGEKQQDELDKLLRDLTTKKPSTATSE